MTNLLAAAAVFLVIHLLISGTPIRDAITRVIGERQYLGLFTAASIAVIYWLAAAYNSAFHTSDNRVLYDLGRGVHDLAIPVVLFAFFLAAQGLMQANPTAVRGEAAATRAGVVHGVIRITRHPALWGVIVWSAFHVAATGDLASVILFGTYLVTALVGTVSIDAKRKRKMGAVWDAFARQTSNVPFAAVIAGRTKLKLGEDFGWRFWVALAIFLIFLFAHSWLFNASPFPNNWAPFS